MALIVLLSVWGGKDLPHSQDRFIPEDKVVHFFLFFIQGMLLLSGLKKQHYQSGLSNSLQIAAGILVGAMLLSEGLQLKIADRYFDFRDLTADLLGIVVAFLVFRLIFGKDIFFS